MDKLRLRTYLISIFLNTFDAPISPRAFGTLTTPCHFLGPSVNVAQIIPALSNGAKMVFRSTESCFICDAVTFFLDLPPRERVLVDDDDDEEEEEEEEEPLVDE